MTTTEITLNFKLISKQLKRDHFLSQPADQQIKAVQTAKQLMDAAGTPHTDRRRLACFLRDLLDLVEGEAKGEIAQALEGWDLAPF